MSFFKDVAFDFINEEISIPNKSDLGIAKYMFTMMVRSKDEYIFDITYVKENRQAIKEIDIRKLNYDIVEIVIPHHSRCRCAMHHYAYKFNKDILYIQMYDDPIDGMILVSNDLGSRQETNVLTLTEEQIQLYYKVKLVAS